MKNGGLLVRDQTPGCPLQAMCKPFLNSWVAGWGSGLQAVDCGDRRAGVEVQGTMVGGGLRSSWREPSAPEVCPQRGVGAQVPHEG